MGVKSFISFVSVLHFTASIKITFFANNTYLSTIEACFKRRRLPIEIMYAGSIYENQIETFSGAKKQRLADSETFKKGILPRRLLLSLSPTYLYFIIGGMWFKVTT